MVINKLLAEALDSSKFLNIPRIESGEREHYKLDGMDVYFITHPRPSSENSVVEIEYALAVKYKGEYIYALSLERENLRTLSSFLGISVKELQGEYQTKGYYSPCHVIAYGNDIKEDLGLWSDLSRESIFSFFSETLLDSFDSIEELEACRD